jgi:hypothetical protein
MGRLSQSYPLTLKAAVITFSLLNISVCQETLSNFRQFSLQTLTKKFITYLVQSQLDSENMKNKVILLLASILLITPFMVLLLPVNADSRIIVVPDDYSTIAGAIENAVNGDTIFVKAGTYDGPINQTIVVDKTIYIVGENAANTIVNFHPQLNITWFYTAEFFTYSDAITVNADNFRLVNLTVDPNGFISINGDRAQITGNNITSGSVTGLRIAGSYCNITGNTSGGSISLSGYFNRIAQNTFYRITINQDSNIIDSNSINIIELSNASQNTISNNHILSETSSYGIDIVGGSCKNEIFGNNVLTLIVDMRISSSLAQNNTFYHNNFLFRRHNELVSLYTYNSTLVNFWDNGKEGNYWGKYNGTDVNGDGIGDAPYVIDDSNVDRYPLMKPWSGNVSEAGFGLLQTLLIAFAVVLLAVGVFLVIYVKRQKSAKKGEFS